MRTRGERNEIKDRTRNMKQRSESSSSELGDMLIDAEESHSTLNPLAEEFEPSNSHSWGSSRSTGENFESCDSAPLSNSTVVHQSSDDSNDDQMASRPRREHRPPRVLTYDTMGQPSYVCPIWGEM